MRWKILIKVNFCKIFKWLLRSFFVMIFWIWIQKLNFERLWLDMEDPNIFYNLLFLFLDTWKAFKRQKMIKTDQSWNFVIFWIIFSHRLNKVPVKMHVKCQIQDKTVLFNLHCNKFHFLLSNNLHDTLGTFSSLYDIWQCPRYFTRDKTNEPYNFYSHEPYHVILKQPFDPKIS